MLEIAEILKMAGDSNAAGLELVVEKDQSIPAAVQYNIRRYNKAPELRFENTGLLIYTFNSNKERENYLQLKFCVAGNMYCSDTVCKNCKLGQFKNCADSLDSLDLIQISFPSTQLCQFIKAKGKTLSDDVLSFGQKTSFTKTLPVCSKIKDIIDGLVNNQYSGSLENIYANAQLHMLLLLSLDCIAGDMKPMLPECRFLNNPADKEKVAQAKEVLMQHIGEPITIKELSLKVAMNECYLKKGFKEMYGTTIFDFYQNQRMEHAKYLLYEKSMSVTDVSLMLGYSSISHFSTAFKKQTGLKPCELLLR